MIQYKLNARFDNGEIASASLFVNAIFACCIPFDSANTDYQQFIKDVTEGVELQDTEGNTLTQQEAEEFIKTLP